LVFFFLLSFYLFTFFFFTFAHSMGNTESQPMLSDTVVSSLPQRTQQRLSQAHTPKKHQPSSFSFFEAAAVAQAPVPKAPLRPSSRKSSSAASSSKSSIEKPSHRSPLSSVRESVISLPELQQLKLTFTEVAGRRYLSTPGTHYHLPCDDDETDRLVILVSRRRTNTSRF
jgi:hypothetical protein